MKFASGEILFYTSPFVFTIELVKIEFPVQEEYGLFYIDNVGAYLAEHDLHRTIEEARFDALMKLDRFYHNRKYQILHQEPEFPKE